MNPHPEEFEYFGIFCRELDVLILSFCEATVESGIEVSGVEAKDAFEDGKGPQCSLPVPTSTQMRVSKHVANRVSMVRRVIDGMSTHLVANLSGVDGGAIFTRIRGCELHGSVV